MLEAITLTTTIESPTLRIQELERFQGQMVEIIILAASPEPAGMRPQPTRTAPKRAGGMLAKYANPAFWEQEATAWQRA